MSRVKGGGGIGKMVKRRTSKKGWRVKKGVKKKKQQEEEKQQVEGRRMKNQVQAYVSQSQGVS